MPKASIKRLIECKKKDLINLVLDIEKYPEFIPFCYYAKIHEKEALELIKDGFVKKALSAYHFMLTLGLLLCFFSQSC